MRLAKITFMFLALSATCIWAQQSTAPAQPGQDKTKKVQAVGDNAPQLSEKDRDLACPAGTGANPAAEGTYRVGGSVKPPRPTSQLAAEFSDEARKTIKKMHLKSFQAISLVTLIVDEQGNPQNVCVKKPAGYGLDGQAVRAVEQYRFDPATKDGSPVPVRIVVEVNFRLY